MSSRLAPQLAQGSTALSLSWVDAREMSEMTRALIVMTCTLAWLRAMVTVEHLEHAVVPRWEMERQPHGGPFTLPIS